MTLSSDRNAAPHAQPSPQSPPSPHPHVVSGRHSAAGGSHAPVNSSSIRLAKGDALLQQPSASPHSRSRILAVAPRAASRSPCSAPQASSSTRSKPSIDGVAQTASFSDASSAGSPSARSSSSTHCLDLLHHPHRHERLVDALPRQRTRQVEPQRARRNRDIDRQRLAALAAAPVGAAVVDHAAVAIADRQVDPRARAAASLAGR